MHNCVRCGRAAASLAEIDSGCPCGSKVFVFNKESVGAIAVQEAPSAPPPLQAAAKPEEGQDGVLAQVAANEGKKEAEGENSANQGKAPESYFARTTFTSEDVENIKILKEGVFLVDIKALSENPVVLKDEEGVYYVKLPFESTSRLKGKALDGNGGSKQEL